MKNVLHVSETPRVRHDIPVRSTLVAALSGSVLMMAACVASTTPTGTWTLERLGQQPPAPDVSSLIVLESDGTVSGSGGCNRLRGHAKFSANTVSFGPMMMTRMACSGTKMTQEQMFTQALDAARHWRIEGDLLVLEDAAHSQLLTFRRS